MLFISAAHPLVTKHAKIYSGLRHPISLASFHNYSSISAENDSFVLREYVSEQVLFFACLKHKSIMLSAGLDLMFGGVLFWFLTELALTQSPCRKQMLGVGLTQKNLNMGADVEV